MLTASFIKSTVSEEEFGSKLPNLPLLTQQVRQKEETMRYPRIQDMRIDADLSQKELGEILHISQRTYSHYETGSRNIPVEMLIRLANYYNTSMDYLVGRTDSKKPPR